MHEIWNYCQYMDDGYTHNIRRIIYDNSKGFALISLQRAQFCPKKLSIEKIGYIIRYLIFSRLAGLEPDCQEVGLSHFLFRTLWILSNMVEVLFNYPRK